MDPIPPSAALSAATAQGILQTAAVGLWTFDPDLDRCQWNEQMFVLHGRSLTDGAPSREQWLATIADVGDAVRLIHRLFGPARSDGQLDCRIHDGRGGSRWLAYRIHLPATGSGSQVSGLCFELTEPPQPPAARNASRSLGLALPSPALLGFGLWRRDLGTDQVLWDAQMYRLRGLEADDTRLPGELQRTTAHCEDLSALRRVLYAYLEGQHSIDHEYRVVWPDGSVRWIGTRVVAELDERGRAIRVLGIEWDASHVHAGATTTESRDVSDSPSVDALNRAKRRFLARVDHDLRIPLQALLTFAQRLTAESSGSLLAHQRQLLRSLQSAGQHLLAIVDDTRDLSGLDVAALPCRVVTVPLAPLVVEVAKWLTPVAAQIGVQLRCGALHGNVMADPLRLRQALIHLLGCVLRDCAPHGSVQIGLCVDPAGSRLGIEIKDFDGDAGATTSSMADDTGAASPDPLDDTRAHAIDGYEHLIRRMGGSLHQDRGSGRASGYRLWLADAEALAPRLTLSPDTAFGRRGEHSRAPSEVVPRHIVCIEDDPHCRTLIEALVSRRRSLSMHLAADGLSGIEAAQRLLPQVILVDLYLPDTDGFEVLRRLRADRSLTAATIVAMSASRMPADIERAKREGFAGYWIKPIDGDRFLDGLDRLAAPPTDRSALDFGELSRIHQP